MDPTLMVYRARLQPDEDGSLIVRFPEWPEALTGGKDRADALAEARDCLNAAILARIEDGEGLPEPVPAGKGEYAIAPFAMAAFKAALHRAMKEVRISVAELARRMAIEHKEARRLLDPYEPTKIQRMEQALSCVDREVIILVQAGQGEARGHAAIRHGFSRAKVRTKVRPRRGSVMRNSQRRAS